jgi:hypothetical protein
MPGVMPEELGAMITATIPVRRRGEPEEMARAALFRLPTIPLAASAPSVDGGLTQLVNPAS